MYPSKLGICVSKGIKVSVHHAMESVKCPVSCASPAFWTCPWTHKSVPTGFLYSVLEPCFDMPSSVVARPWCIACCLHQLPGLHNTQWKRILFIKLNFNHTQTPQRFVVPKRMVKHVPEQTLLYMLTQVSLSEQESTFRTRKYFFIRACTPSFMSNQ